MTNEEIKKYAKQCGVRMYELATEFEMNESVLSRMFRCELDEEMKQAIITTIDKIATEKEVSGTGGKKLSATSLMRERVLGKAKVQEKTVSSATKISKTPTKTSKSTTKASEIAQTSVITNDMFDDLFAETEFMTEGGGNNG